jgi:hypothetical protein
LTALVLKEPSARKGLISLKKIQNVLGLILIVLGQEQIGFTLELNMGLTKDMPHQFIGRHRTMDGYVVEIVTVQCGF